MRYKHFKNADADISALTVGTWGIAGANSAGVTWGDVDTEESIAAIRQMIDNGVNIRNFMFKSKRYEATANIGLFGYFLCKKFSILNILV